MNIKDALFVAQEEEGGAPEARKRAGRKRGRNSVPGGTVDGAADVAARKLNALVPKLQLGGQDRHFVAQREQARAPAARLPVRGVLHLEGGRICTLSRSASRRVC